MYFQNCVCFGNLNEISPHTTFVSVVKKLIESVSQLFPFLAFMSVVEIFNSFSCLSYVFYGSFKSLTTVSMSNICVLWKALIAVSMLDICLLRKF